MPGIVVGVDGSENSRRALAWAMNEALLRGVPLTAMTVLPAAVHRGTTAFWDLPAYQGQGSGEEHARQAVRAFVQKAAAEMEVGVSEATGYAAEELDMASQDADMMIVRVAVTVATGDVAEELARASRDADMLVVGIRGDGGLASRMKDPVCFQVTRKADCPVTIVPGPHR